MGTICTPSYANIFMDHFERKCTSRVLQRISLIYLRFYKTKQLQQLQLSNVTKISKNSLAVTNLKQNSNDNKQMHRETRVMLTVFQR